MLLKRLKMLDHSVCWPKAFYSRRVSLYQKESSEEGFSSFRLKMWPEIRTLNILPYFMYFLAFLLPVLLAILTLTLPLKSSFFSQPSNVAVIAGFLYFPLSMILVAMLHEKIVERIVLNQMKSPPEWEGVFLVSNDKNRFPTKENPTPSKKMLNVSNLWILVAPFHHIKGSYLSSDKPFALIRPSDRFDIDLKIRQAHPDNFAIPVVSTPSCQLHSLIPADILGLSEKNLLPKLTEQQRVRRTLMELFDIILQDFPQLGQGQEEYFLTDEGFVYSPKLLLR